MPMGLGIGLSLDFGGKVGSLLPTAPVGSDYAFLSHPSYWASDASHLVPCAAGDAIRWWKDAVTGTWYQQATSGSRLIARLDATGKWYAEGTGTQQHPWVDLSAQSATNATFAAAYRQYSAVPFAVIMRSGVRDLDFDGTSLKPATLNNNASSRIVSASADSLNTDYRNIATFNGATTTLYHNGTQVAQTAADTTSGNMSANTSSVGLFGFTTYCPNGRFYGGAIFLTPSVNITTLDATLHGYCTS